MGFGQAPRIYGFILDIQCRAVIPDFDIPNVGMLTRDQIDYERVCLCSGHASTRHQHQSKNQCNHKINVSFHLSSLPYNGILAGFWLDDGYSIPSPCNIVSCHIHYIADGLEFQQKCNQMIKAPTRGYQPPRKGAFSYRAQIVNAYMELWINSARSFFNCRSDGIWIYIICPAS